MLHCLQCVSYATTVCSRIVIISVYLGMICMILPYEQKQNSMICMHSGFVVHRSQILLENQVMFNGSLFVFSMFN